MALYLTTAAPPTMPLQSPPRLLSPRGRRAPTFPKERSFEFLKFLEDEGLKRPCDKEELREVYYQRFKPLCQAQNLETRGASFSAIFKVWVHHGLVRNSGNSANVSFATSTDPNVTTRKRRPRKKKGKNQNQNNVAGRTPTQSPSPAPVGASSVKTSAKASAKASATRASASSSLASQLTSDDSIPLWIKIGSDKVTCKVCGETLLTKADLPKHSTSRNHRVQGLILALKENKSQLVKNKGGIVISCPNDGDQGSVHFEVQEKQEVMIRFEIRNESEETIVFKKCELLKKVGVFSLSDSKNVTVNASVKIAPGSIYTVNLATFADNVGRYRTWLSFMFASTDQPDKHINIIRVLSCRCKDSVVEDAQPTSPYNPVRKSYYPPRVDIVEGSPPDLESSSRLETEIPLKQFRIPNPLRDVLQHRMEAKGLSGLSLDCLDEVKPVLDNSLCWPTYTKRFSTLLHAEEIQMELDIRNYDLEGATMNKAGNLLTLKVPGLAENRPSVLRGDVLFATKILADGSKENREYKGYVHEVYQDEVGIGFNKKLHEEFVKNMKFAVRFTFNRFGQRLMHRSVVLADENSLEKMLCPAPETACAFQNIVPASTNMRLVNSQLEKNTEQRQAIKYILMGTSRPAPYLIFGPPGTGKTVTLVEAIQQVLIHIPGACVLACAPSNSAADLIAERLIHGKVERGSIYRMCAVSRSYATVPEKIKDICNYDKFTKRFHYPCKQDLLKYKVIVTTLVTSGRIATANFPPGHFSHVFVDEAGHAAEPEAVIALAGIIEPEVNTKNGSQVVLAGDPEQLGPILRSPIAVKYGLGTSLLERLMKTCSVYSRKENDAKREVYDVRVVTKLLQNYRSHPSILDLPNKLFYHSELVACADKMKRECLCTWKELPKKGFPLIFHGVAGQDTREAKSPSFFNPEEVAKVVEYIQKLMEVKSPKLQPSDIGVISPYRRQVQKLQAALKKKNMKEIKVGSVEEFQGQERMVIVISTVRSNPDYLSVDAEYKIGFLANPKRFNVAITRAKALLIVIGNPATLARDAHWKKLLDFCVANSAYKGCYYSTAEDEFEDIAQRISAMKLDDIGQAAAAEDLPWRNDP